MTSDEQPTRPLTDEQLAQIRDAVERRADHYSDRMLLLAEVDRLRAELAEMETDRDKYQNWYDNACDEVAEAYRARNEED